MIIDLVRSDYRHIFEKSPMAKMSLEQCLNLVHKEGMFVNHMYENQEGRWWCYLRYRANNLLADSGHGADMAECLFHAIEKARKAGFQNRDLPAPTKVEQARTGLGGSKNGLSLSSYVAPAAREIPSTDPVPAAILGETVAEFEEIEGEEEDDIFGATAAPVEDDDDDFLK